MDNPPEITAESIQQAVESQDLIDGQLSEAVQRVARERERLLALALHKGYDGIDVLPNDDHADGTMDRFRIGFEWEGWQDEPPQRGQFERFQRYDFRELTEREREEILSQIGVHDAE